MPRRPRYRFCSDRLPASRRPVVVTEETPDSAGLQLAGDRQILLTLREDASAGTARHLADLLNEAVENVSLLAG